MKAMKVQRKVRRGNSFSSERRLGTHSHKFLDKPSGKDEHGDIHTEKSSEKHIKIRYKCGFCEKTTQFELKTQLSIDLSNLTLINGCVKQSFDKKCRQWLHFFVNCTQNPLISRSFAAVTLFYYIAVR